VTARPRAAARREHRVAGLPEAISHYTDAASAAGLLFVSGIVSVDARGELVGAGDPVAQTHRIFEIMGAVLADAGCSFADVVRVTVYLTDVEDRTRINPVRREVFGQTLPASTLVEVSRLAVPGALVEIECVAALSEP
jgi:2-iminobutanoate/2-iminopropanoate deaminase